MDNIDIYTSTGKKFWCHRDKMESYLYVTGKSVISTHISPEGSCNLACDYCSVHKRDKHFRIEFEVIVDYISKLLSRGLKAVIITGGGEPVMYPQFNRLIKFLYDCELSIGLITNGTLNHKVKFWDYITWARISMNQFKNWQRDTFIPRDTECLFGGSIIYTDQTFDYFLEVRDFAKRNNFKYIRILPDCLVKGELFHLKHKQIAQLVRDLDDPIFFHQPKVHGTPKSDICHQSYFRPYLSEVDGGTVYPCDSVVLNHEVAKFAKTYQLCKAKDILKYLDGKISQEFVIKEDCADCVFTYNVDMLNDWRESGVPLCWISEPVIHAEFV